MNQLAEGETVYFEKVSPKNMLRTLCLVGDRLEAKDIRKLVVGSRSGDSAAGVLEFFHGDGSELILVPHGLETGRIGGFPLRHKYGFNHVHI
jgi:hypothetical protein